MKVPISWLKEFVDIDLPIEDLAHRMTLAGLEVEEIHYIGLPKPQGKQQYKITGFSWEPENIVVGAIHEVMPRAAPIMGNVPCVNASNSARISAKLPISGIIIIACKF